MARRIFDDGFRVPTTYNIYVNERKVLFSATPLPGSGAFGLYFVRITGLKSNTVYDVTVSAEHAGGEGPRSSTIQIATLAIRAGTPTNLRVNPASVVLPNSFEVIWTAPANADEAGITHYRVFWTPTVAGGRRSTLITAPTTSAVITELEPVTNYTIQVLAINSLGSGDRSTAISVTTGAFPGIPGKPATTTVSSYSSISVEWSEARQTSAQIISYNVYWRNTSGASESSATVSASTLSYSIPNLSSSTEYDITVEAVDANGSRSGRSEALSERTADPQAPDAPPVTMSDQTSNSITLSWTPPASHGADITAYKVRWRISTEDDSNELMSGLLPSTQTNYVITGLSPGMTYAIEVVAINSAGEGMAAEREVTTDAIAPEQPEQPEIGNRTSESITVNWTPPASGGATITTYRVYWVSSEYRLPR